LVDKAGPLGGRKPTELLAEMELCTRGQESYMFFLFLFLQRMTGELKIMLDEDAG
jgi:hypothetical protein